MLLLRTCTCISLTTASASRNIHLEVLTAHLNRRIILFRSKWNSPLFAECETQVISDFWWHLHVAIASGLQFAFRQLCCQVWGWVVALSEVIISGFWTIPICPFALSASLGNYAVTFRKLFSCSAISLYNMLVSASSSCCLPPKRQRPLFPTASCSFLGVARTQLGSGWGAEEGAGEDGSWTSAGGGYAAARARCGHAELRRKLAPPLPPSSAATSAARLLQHRFTAWFSNPKCCCLFPDFASSSLARHRRVRFAKQRPEGNEDQRPRGRSCCCSILWFSGLHAALTIVRFYEEASSDSSIFEGSWNSIRSE